MSLGCGSPFAFTFFVGLWSQKTYVCVSGVKMSVFRKIWRALFSWNTRFEICPFTLLPTNSGQPDCPGFAQRFSWLKTLIFSLSYSSKNVLDNLGTKSEGLFWENVERFEYKNTSCFLHVSLSCFMFKRFLLALEKSSFCLINRRTREL